MAQNDSASASAPIAQTMTSNLAALRSLEGVEFPRSDQPHILTVSNQKGGVGKTTTAVNLAVALALGGLEVLVVDIDPQGNASTALAVSHEPGVPSTYDVLTGELGFDDVIVPCPDVPGVRVSPATIDLAGAEVELVDIFGREKLLSRALNSYLEEVGGIDIVLIDCPPSLGLLTLNAFVAADQVLIPVQTEYYALEGLSLLWRTVDRVRERLNPDLRISHLLLTMVDGRTNLSAEVANEVREHFHDLVMETEIPRSVRISEAPSYGMSVVAYEPRGTGAVAYRRAAYELSERLVKADS